MIAKGTVITHGGNAVRYSTDKERAEIVKVNHLPENISSSAMWTRMMTHQQKFKEKLNCHRPLKNTSVRIEISPAKEETIDWTMSDWVRLADEYIREFDAIDLSKKAKRDSARHTNLQNSQYVVSLHHDSKGQILHLHINANRIDMDGNVNDAHYIKDRAMMAANKIAEKRGWVQAETKRQRNIDQITKDSISILHNMDFFDWNIYAAKLQDKGYDVMLKRDVKGMVVGYTVKKGNSCYKSSAIGHSRNLTPSRIEMTWERLHHGNVQDVQATKSGIIRSGTPVTMERVQTSMKFTNGGSRLQTSVNPEPVMCHHDIEVQGKHYDVNIPEEINHILMSETTLPDNVLWSTLDNVRETALLLFANYIDAATEVANSCGGGGNTSCSGWGRDKDEDDKDWAHRCAKMAHLMHMRLSRKYHR